LALIANSPARLPVAVGAKLTLIWQFADLAITFPTQLSVSVKSLAALPIVATLATERAVVPVVVSVTVCVADTVPTVCPVNVNEAGAAVAVVTVLPAVTVGTCQTPRP
jgi:hypothetical protein